MVLSATWDDQIADWFFRSDGMVVDAGFLIQTALTSGLNYAITALTSGLNYTTTVLTFGLNYAITALTSGLNYTTTVLTSGINHTIPWIKIT